MGLVEFDGLKLVTIFAIRNSLNARAGGLETISVKFGLCCTFKVSAEEPLLNVLRIALLIIELNIMLTAGLVTSALFF